MTRNIFVTLAICGSFIAPGSEARETAASSPTAGRSVILEGIADPDYIDDQLADFRAMAEETFAWLPTMRAQARDWVAAFRRECDKQAVRLDAESAPTVAQPQPPERAPAPSGRCPVSTPCARFLNCPGKKRGHVTTSDSSEQVKAECVSIPPDKPAHP